MTQGALGFGFRIGHWTEAGRRTGCTVILPPADNVASCDIRGSSPSSRELPLLDLERRLSEVHAVLLTGGSAFGLAAAEGVVSWLEERNIGYRTRIATVPIVPAAVIFDAAAGAPGLRPRAEAGRAACETATDGPVEIGRVGAGAGATVGKWAGFSRARPGGLGIASARAEGQSVSAVVVVNSVGDVVGADGSVVTGGDAPQAGTWPEEPASSQEDVPTNTVIGLIAVQANLDKREVRWLAARGSDGITVSVRPAHTRYDGDVVFAVAAPAPGDVPPDLDLLGRLATEAVAAAVRAGVGA
ncbi:MAG: P1 family peptidase [Actinomycetota bacterium]|nr:P1 family peptidase [Actinomycetota bacterium]